MKLEDSYRVNASEALFGDLKVILGPRCLAG
jgi:DNA polymerase-3 subunit alpha